MSLSTRTTAHFWASGGGALSTLMPCYPSASGLPQKYLRPLQMPSNGSYSIAARASYGTTLMTSSFVVHLHPLNAPAPLTPPSQHAANWACLYQRTMWRGRPRTSPSWASGNSITQTLSLPDDKLERLQHLLTAWGDKTHCTCRELQSLIGILNHACKVVRPGRSFIRRMLDLL